MFLRASIAAFALMVLVGSLPAQAPSPAPADTAPLEPSAGNPRGGTPGPAVPLVVLGAGGVYLFVRRRRALQRPDRDV